MDWLPGDDVTPTPNDVECVALALESEHGALAAGVAEFFADVHSQQGDAGRAWAWQGVAALVRQRAIKRGVLASAIERTKATLQ